MQNLNQWHLTDHAAARAQQRGISRETINFVIANADVWLHAGGGTNSVRISKKKIPQLKKNGGRSSQRDRAQNVVLLLDQKSASIITVMHDTGTRQSRRYRKQLPTWNR